MLRPLSRKKAQEPQRTIIHEGLNLRTSRFCALLWLNPLSAAKKLRSARDEQCMDDSILQVRDQIREVTLTFFAVFVPSCGQILSEPQESSQEPQEVEPLK